MMRPANCPRTQDYAESMPHNIPRARYLARRVLSVNNPSINACLRLEPRLSDSWLLPSPLLIPATSRVLAHGTDNSHVLLIVSQAPQL